MAKKYHNLEAVSLFGQYQDPCSDRRGTGPVRPHQPMEAAKPDFFSLPQNGLACAWLGHSSVFLRLEGKSILIDPIFSQYCSPVPMPALARFPGQTLTADLFPRIDCVLITHNHYDHMDRATLKALNQQTARFIAPEGVGRYLRRFGIPAEKITELNWYDEFSADGMRIICTPSQHSSARSPFDNGTSLWCSYFLKSGKYSVFDTGDGGFGGHFSEIRRRYGTPDLAIMECGQYNVRWHGLHMFPEESVQAAKNLGAGLAIPVHWGSFVLSDHAWEDPPKRFAQRAKELEVPCRIPKLYEWIT